MGKRNRRNRNNNNQNQAPQCRCLGDFLLSFIMVTLVLNLIAALMGLTCLLVDYYPKECLVVGLCALLAGYITKRRFNPKKENHLRFAAAKLP